MAAILTLYRRIPALPAFVLATQGAVAITVVIPVAGVFASSIPPVQERVTNQWGEWEVSQRSLNLMGQHSSPMQKVSAKSLSRMVYL